MKWNLTKQLKKYDVVFIDYGEMEDEGFEKSISILREYYLVGSKLVWCGAMINVYNRLAQEDMPKIRFLHNLDVCPMEVEKLMWFLNNWGVKND